jgi:diguanylate cyclase (GGDEF)-like protein/PAS domain S-box-containing protein
LFSWNCDVKDHIFLRYRLSPPQRYGLALVVFAAAFLLRLVILPVSAGYPFVTLYPAAVAVLYFCGIGPGLLVVACSAVAGAYVYVPPYWAFSSVRRDYFIVAYYLIGTMLTAMVMHPLQRYLQMSHRALEKLRDSENRFRSFMDNSNFIAWMKDEEGRYVFMSRPCEELFETPPEVWAGHTDFDIFDKDLAQYLRNQDNKALHSDHAVVSEDSATTPEGRTIHWLSSRFRYVDSAGQRYVGGIAIDITERIDAEKQVESLAFYDPLTNLPNRRLLLDRLEHSLNNAVRQNHLCALLFIDLDNFKTLNDTYGHKRGDLLLMQVSQRLSKAVRKSDTLARLGGDEFVMLLESLSGDSLEAAKEAQKVAEKLLASTGQPYTIDDAQHSTTPSIGITLFGDVEESVEEPLRRADLAMYEAKAAGRNTFRFFDPKLQEAVAKRTFLEADLRSALQKNQLSLHFQPQIGADDKPFGAEVLLRWHHPKRGLISPLEFIPVAEESGLIVAIGRWVLDTACAQLARWAVNSEFSHLSISINVSMRQFYQPDFVAQVLASIAESGADPQRLKLELTESLLAANVEDVIKKMTALKEEGIGFSLDDFGTGYSSLAYLKQLPLDQLKIDQSFIRDTLTDANDAAIVKTIIALADSLNLSVIAEGVETDEQHRFLANSGCNTYQGYLFSKPLPVEEFEAYVAERYGLARA